jgi:D-alanyl-lipoteichoic acid acyltransferase DltB (MBOAT superfamily)
MLFTSPQYYLLLAASVAAFYLVGARYRWVALVLPSVGFYSGFGAPSLLAVLAWVALSNFWLGLRIASSISDSIKRGWFWAGVALNLGALVFAKYADVCFGGRLSEQFVVTVGVSYYTVQATSYLADIYRGVAEPERHPGYFLLYLCFFPKLAQGPIERANDLLPQLRSAGRIEYVSLRRGAVMIALGLFKKMVLADRLGPYVDPVFDVTLHHHVGATLIAAAYVYAAQIYLDFSGYTDIALGSARLFNIRLTPNFASPYLSLSVPEFWRRWHISFSRCILDYIFRPLQRELRDWGKLGTVLALLAAFLFSGFWHGTGWPFIAWGLLHGLYLAASVVTAPARRRLNRVLPLPAILLNTWRWLLTFNLIALSWIVFRCGTLADAWYFVSHIGLQVKPGVSRHLGLALVLGSLAGGPFMGWLASKKLPLDPCEILLSQPTWLRWSIYYAMALAILLFGVNEHHAFLYTRF